MSNKGDLIEGKGYTLLAGRGQVRQQAVNDQSFEAKPLSIAIDELAIELSAANDQHNADALDRSLVIDLDELPGWFYKAANAPADLPNPADAVSGFGFAVCSLVAYMPELAPLAAGFESLRQSQILTSSSNARQRRPLAGRREKFQTWDLCLRLSEESAAQLKVPAAILAAAIVASYLQGVTADARLLKKLKNVCIGGDPKKGRWTRSAQTKALHASIEQLRSACIDNGADAKRLGLTPQLPAADERVAPNPEQLLNQQLQKRWSSSADYTPPRIRQGTLGHGTLTVDLARDCGLALRHGAEAGDAVQVVIVFEVLFNLTPALIHAIPISDDDAPAGAWIRLSLARNAVRIDLEWVIAGGAKPASGTEHLYEDVTRTYWVVLPPWMREVWNALSQRSCVGAATTLGQLLGDASHHPKVDIMAGTSAYILTANRLRQTLPNLALSAGTPRMVTTLMLCQFGLVSPGRPYYGLVHGSDLATGYTHLYRKLGWLGRRERLSELQQKTGSLVVPTDAALSEVFASMTRTARLAEQEFEDNPNEEQWIRRHQALIAYLALAAELDLCLRKSDRYELSAAEISSEAQRVHVNDKHVHDLGGGPALGKSSTFQALVTAWVAYLQSVDAEPCLQQSALGGALRLACQRHRAFLHEIGRPRRRFFMVRWEARPTRMRGTNSAAAQVLGGARRSRLCFGRIARASNHCSLCLVRPGRED